MARTKEQRAWDSFSKSVDKSRLKLQRIECLYSGEAVPDVLGQNKKGVAFWLELKALDGWPKRNTTCPMKGIFEPGQLAYLRSWWHWQGRAYVLLRVGLDYYLMDPRDNLEVMTHHDIIGHCEEHGKEDIINFLESMDHHED